VHRSVRKSTGRSGQIELVPIPCSKPMPKSHSSERRANWETNDPETNHGNLSRNCPIPSPTVGTYKVRACPRSDPESDTGDGTPISSSQSPPNNSVSFVSKPRFSGGGGGGGGGGGDDEDNKRGPRYSSPCANDAPRVRKSDKGHPETPESADVCSILAEMRQITTSVHQLEDVRANVLSISSSVRKLEEKFDSVLRRVPHVADRLCVVCFDAPRDVVCVPCGHFTLCHRCVDTIFAHTPRCPTCRIELDHDDLLPVFL